MSGFQNAVQIGGTIIILPTCDGNGGWECRNPLPAGQILCDACLAEEDGKSEPIRTETKEPK